MSGRSDAPISDSARRWTLVAMTLANSMILVDQTAVPLAVPDLIQDLGGQLDEGPWILTANILPLAALVVLGGRLGDLLGLRRVFLAGAAIFVCSSALVGFSQDTIMAIAARALQGCGAALMMPTALAIVSSVYTGPDRGRALGILAGASAFFAACGPVLGGVLTSVDWRLVFLINVPIAIVTILMTLRSVPELAPLPGATRDIDYPGVITFGLGMALIVFGLTQGSGESDWTQPAVVGALAGAVLSLTAFVVIEHRVANPLIEFRLLRHLNFLAAMISQVLAGMVELGMGFLLPAYLLLVVGVSPEVAGLMLIPSTLPIILAGPLSGRAFDRMGGRAPLVFGFVVLALSGLALGLAAPEQSFATLIPGLVLQGIGLGVVLTVNDPTGLTAVPEKDQGQGAGMINTAEQMGGALGIAVLTAVLLGYYWGRIEERIESLGYGKVTQGEMQQGRDFILQVEQEGRKTVEESGEVPEKIRYVLNDIVDLHAQAYEVTFFAAGGIALLGAIACFLLVRKTDRIQGGPVFTRRSRWLYATSGRGPAITKRPDPGR
ncbi:MAG: DHA2 family efflux MFS transporter permease subunit [Actinobacteria bacterium]|nr:DHA2 family efflux MFS transporter permease subunit [Actinomycetota bacterium]